jgi:molybdate transport system ATP-binding protein
MLSVSVRRQFGGFALEVHWESPAPVVALVGPSGSGKTLTLHCIAGLVAPDAGRIAVGDRVLFDSEASVNLTPQLRRVGYVFQGYALFPHLTVAQNVGYGLHGRPQAAREARAAQEIERLGLTEVARRYPSEISGGQQQRVALARALATDPDLLLLDEPLSALDTPLRRDLRNELARTLREWAGTTVLVTHDLAEAYQIADVVVLYEGGRTIEATPKDDLLWKPSSERVARLIGARNILRGTVIGASSQSVFLKWRGQTLEAAQSPSHVLKAAPGDSLAFFIRPEYVRLVRKDRAAPDPRRHVNLFAGDVVGERDEGTTWTLFFRVAAPGRPDQNGHDLEIEVPKLVYERLGVARDRSWQISVHPGSVQILPAV